MKMPTRFYTVFVVLSLLLMGACATSNRHLESRRIDEYLELHAALSSQHVAGHSALQWFLMLVPDWWGRKDLGSDVATAVRTVGEGYLPLVVKCLSKQGLVINEGPGQKAKEEIENNRVRALAVCWILREHAAPVIPDLVKLLEDKSWDERLYVANAVASIGSAASNTIPLALTDLTSENTGIRFQSLIILGGIGGQSEEAVKTLIRYTGSDSEQLQGTAVWGLGRVIKASDSDLDLAKAARAHLELLARGQGGSHVYVCACHALGWDPNAPRESHRD